MTDTPPAAPHTPSDDPRVDELLSSLDHLVTMWASGRTYSGSARPEDDLRSTVTRFRARLDAAVPARDDALARWLDGEIAEELGRLTRVVNPLREERIRVLREVRDRLGATTNTTPEGSTDD